MSDPQIEPAAVQPKAKTPNGFLAGVREFGIIIIVALVLSALVRAFLVQAFYVPSESMENTLLPNDRIIASKITTHFGGVSRGEVVVFKDPGGWLGDPGPAANGIRGALHTGLMFIGLLPSDSGSDLVKRAIGIAGDHVVCCDKLQRIVLNGVPLNESYVIQPTNQVKFDVKVPADSVFVMGDNRGNSRDSRYHLDVNSGGVPLEDVVGRAFVVVWPLNRFTYLSIPDIFGDPALQNQSTTPEL
ncbi:MAG: signal peptidase I [Actinomycetota bacterium]|nr:signal peptidase I [Actinomycetota bacterium]